MNSRVVAFNQIYETIEVLKTLNFTHAEIMGTSNCCHQQFKLDGFTLKCLPNPKSDSPNTRTNDPIIGSWTNRLDNNWRFHLTGKATQSNSNQVAHWTYLTKYKICRSPVQENSYYAEKIENECLPNMDIPQGRVYSLDAQVTNGDIFPGIYLIESFLIADYGDYQEQYLKKRHWGE